MYSTIFEPQVIELYPISANEIEDVTSNGNGDSIESTMRFKYIRSLEALFESTPQAVLQLVYLMRTSKFTGNGIFIISILQSIISMTNSMLNADNAYMQRDVFKADKRRLPPSLGFIKHSLLRLCEITHRIFLLALFWTVVGGAGFCVVFAFECILAFAWIYMNQFDVDTLFLTLNQVCMCPNVYTFSFVYIFCASVR